MPAPFKPSIVKAALIARINKLPRRYRSSLDTFISVLSKTIHFMKPEIGFISWVSHTTIGGDIHLSKKAVRYYLEAAVLIGAVKVKFTNPWLAHRVTWNKYGNSYFTYLGGKNFMQATCPDGKRKRIYFYTINHKWIGYKNITELPAWQVEVIRLCAWQKQDSLNEARVIASNPEAWCPRADNLFGPSATISTSPTVEIVPEQPDTTRGDEPVEDTPRIS